MAPATAGIVSARLGIDGIGQVVLLAVAGFIEGLVLGTGQAVAMPLRVRRCRYALLTGAGAMLVWASVMTMMLIARSEIVSFAPKVMIGVAVGFLGLLAIGGAQWIELRRRIRRAHRWIAWTALAWTLALPLSFLPSPFVDESTPIAVHLVAWGCGGALMAFVMAAITWLGIRHWTEA